eukprot:2570788-Rhodomonas_salina.3
MLERRVRSFHGIRHGDTYVSLGNLAAADNGDETGVTAEFQTFLVETFSVHVNPCCPAECNEGTVECPVLCSTLADAYRAFMSRRRGLSPSRSVALRAETSTARRSHSCTTTVSSRRTQQRPLSSTRSRPLLMPC